jgi:hypothetical protein
VASIGDGIMLTKFWSEYVKGRKKLGDLALDGTTKLK